LLYDETRYHFTPGKVLFITQKAKLQIHPDPCESFNFLQKLCNTLHHLSENICNEIISLRTSPIHDGLYYAVERITIFVFGTKNTPDEPGTGSRFAHQANKIVAAILASRPYLPEF